jgi:hypothetical protein
VSLSTQRAPSLPSTSRPAGGRSGARGCTRRQVPPSRGSLLPERPSVTPSRALLSTPAIPCRQPTISIHRSRVAPTRTDPHETDESDEPRKENSFNPRCRRGSNGLTQLGLEQARGGVGKEPPTGASGNETGHCQDLPRLCHALDPVRPAPQDDNTLRNQCVARRIHRRRMDPTLVGGDAW